jgi:hypothetical protein
MEMPLRLIGLVAPPDQLKRAHEDLPIIMRGGNRKINDAAKAESFTDNVLNPGGTPNTVQPGVIVGLPRVKLDITGGPGCSARITTPDHNLQLMRDSELILVVQSAP